MSDIFDAQFYVSQNGVLRLTDAVVESKGKAFIATSEEYPEAYGFGSTPEKAVHALKQHIEANNIKRKLYPEEIVDIRPW